MNGKTIEWNDCSFASVIAFKRELRAEGIPDLGQ